MPQMFPQAADLLQIPQTELKCVTKMAVSFQRACAKISGGLERVVHQASLTEDMDSPVHLYWSMPKTTHAGLQTPMLDCRLPMLDCRQQPTLDLGSRTTESEPLIEKYPRASSLWDGGLEGLPKKINENFEILTSQGTFLYDSKLDNRYCLDCGQPVMDADTECLCQWRIHLMAVSAVSSPPIGQKNCHVATFFSRNRGQMWPLEPRNRG